MPGGRPKGSKNRTTEEMRALMERRVPGFNPIIWMLLVCRGDKADYAELNIDPDNEPTLDQRIVCANHTSHYIAPKLKAIEITDDSGQRMRRLIIAKTDAGLEEMGYTLREPDDTDAPEQPDLLN